MELSAIKELEKLTVGSCVKVIRNEHPQIIAVILVLMETIMAKNVLEGFTERLRNDVVLRMATMDEINTYWLDKLNKGILKAINVNQSGNNVDLKALNKAKELLSIIENRDILADSISEYDPDLLIKLEDGEEK